MRISFLSVKARGSRVEAHVRAKTERARIHICQRYPRIQRVCRKELWGQARDQALSYLEPAYKMDKISSPSNRHSAGLNPYGARLGDTTSWAGFLDSLNDRIRLYL